MISNSNQPIVIIGGFLSYSKFYSDMTHVLSELSGQSVYICQISVSDWLMSFSAKGWLNIILKLKTTINYVLEKHPNQKITLIGHSSGGVIGRLYLSHQPFQGYIFNGLKHVNRLITLGSPHYSIHSSPMRSYVQRILPDAFYGKQVDYISISGTAVDLRINPSIINVISRICYQLLCGNGKTNGDGLVPVECALLKDSIHIIVEGAGHPFLFASNWYGKPENVKIWWSKIVSLENNSEYS